MSSAGIETYEDFVKVHGVLLAASGLPQSLHRKLFQKLAAEAFDGGCYFQVEPVDDGRQRRLILTAESLGKESDVFLVDHAWTFRHSDAYKQLQEFPGLAERMAALMCVDTDLNSEEASDTNDVKPSAMEIVEREFCKVKEGGNNSVMWLELEDLEMDDSTLVSLDLPSKFPHLIALSLCNNKLKDLEISVKVISQFKHLRALWLNHNPILKISDNYVEATILQNCPGLEIYNSRFTLNYGEWALGFCGGSYDKDNPGFSCQSDRILQNVTSFDLSNRCIHHLNTKAFSHLEMPNLSHLNLRGNSFAGSSIHELLEYIKGFINLTSLEVDIPGPLGDNALDIIEALPNILLLNRLSVPKILESEKYIVDSMLETRLPQWGAGESLTDRIINALWFYAMTYRLADEEKIDETSVWYNVFCHSDGSALHVYTDIPQVEELLTRPEFVITAEPKNADIIWTSVQVDEEMKAAVGLNDKQFINQFPFEACIVMKHHLAETIQKAHGAPQWLQPTYNLETHLIQLIGDYYRRQKEGIDNLWILKPWNMARTIDTTVTQNLSAIIRLMETGPKICQKYIEHPALFKGRKFDIRYIVLVRSINPLEIFLADVFWFRLANNSYSLDKHSFFEYETHFTVMNYRGRLNHMNTPEFVKEFEQEHQVLWMDIHQRIKSMIRSVFESAALVHPEMHNPTSRAMYGIDVMLDCHYQPKLLEVTYCPDCTRACKYDTEAIFGEKRVIKGSEFYNFVFGCLFLNETTHVSPL
ncbi:uncharacterized protein [Primulina huaijiensis]|uniref:uncharacterized protein n=1 Tax=Primulina huaijiensis TaxID=1492673 RepID=UPI003CC7448B